MQLVEEGALDLDAPIRRYLPDFATADAVTATLTVRQLLTHTSGMDGHFFPAVDADGPSAPYVQQMSALGQLHATGAWMRTAERRVGTECVCTCRSRGSPDH